jgi:rfaE bifunctional protein kinase chain/domain/rfaE bifunctional protein nucleotidyltransferase chain/domain
MTQSIKNKMLLLEDLLKKVESLKHAGKVIVQSHGIFDLIHPGIITHLNSAKTQGDVLIVTVVKDKDVRRGPGRPIFPENLRAENVASLSQVDYVCIVDDENPFECVRKIKPDIFAKGQAYKERDRKIHDKIFEEEKEFYFGKSRIYETQGFSFSASQIINNFLYIYPEETKGFLKKFAKKYSFDDILEGINNLQKLRVLLIGDGIIDEYHYCEPLGRSAKTHIVVNRYLNHEVFAGGVLAIANHIAGLCSEVHLLTALGNDDTKEDFILNTLKPSIQKKFFYRDDAPTIIKKRYVNQYLNQKLFEINFLNTKYINKDLESTIIKYLKTQLPLHDLVFVSDYGHGFITSNIIKVIESYSKKLAVNTQINAANAGYNMITKYSNPFYVCLDEPEIRIAAQDRYGNIEEVAMKVKNSVNAEYLIVTLGKRGSIGIGKKNEINRTPIFSTKVIDTIGAGDAFFAFTAPCFAQGIPLDMVSFIGNAVGALAVQIVGNKKPVEKYELLEFIHTLLR